MKITNIARSFVSIMILFLVVHPTWGAEKATEKGPAEERVSKNDMKEVELDGPLALQIKAFVDTKLTKEREELKRELAVQAELLAKVKELEERCVAQDKDFKAKLAAQDKDFKAKLAAQEKRFDESQKSQIENISKVIKQEPPSFTQRITPNKYIWAVTGFTLASITLTFVHNCDSVSSVPYAAAKSVMDNLPFLINLYYGAKIIQEATNIKGNLAYQAAQ